ncbi:MAG: hypothetical protein K5744_11705 [Eubacterium sp.]|jgi:hypothetical protein|uniref:Uncharacterized protein n=1 Tax=Eubacterium cellulosolvens (strain ATCC 43171 / JCM 9499 / 6) TaxID=633697 RepID=I5AR66_EUBC6|nr:hypothetical protein [Eubacterium sp.]
MFEDFSKKAREIGEMIGDGAVNLGGAASSKAKLEMKKKELRDAYAELGRIYYNENKDNVPVECTDLFDKIEAALAACDELKSHIDENMSNLKK